MDPFTIATLRTLLADHAPPCVSIYLATHPSGPEGQQDPVRLKNLLNRAEDDLADRWMRAVNARELLQRARALPDDTAYWQARSQGLAIFISLDTFERYRLPLNFEETVSVDERFTIQPLLPLVRGDDRFLILALSQNKVQLFEADRYRIQKVDVPKLPTVMREALDYVSVDRGSQVHAAMHQQHRKQSAVFHGQGGKAEAHKDDLQQFFRMVDAALKLHLRSEHAPLLLAGVEYLPPIFRKVTSYPHVLDSSLICNCDYLAQHELHQRALPLVEPALAEKRHNAAKRLVSVLNTGDATDDLERILVAAHAGRVDTLFVETQVRLWGTYDDLSGKVERHAEPRPSDYELIGLAAVQTLSHHGTVYSVPRGELPTVAPIAALLRYGEEHHRGADT